MKKLSILRVTPDNVADTGIYCIKDKKSPGYHRKPKSAGPGFKI